MRTTSGSRSAAPLLPEARGVNRRTSQPAACPPVGRCRRGASRDRLQPGPDRGAQRTRAPLFQDPPHVQRGARRRHARGPDGAPCLDEGTSLRCWRGADGRRVRVQLSSRRREAVASELADQAVHRRPARGGSSAIPPARSPPLQGGRDAGGGVSIATVSQRLSHARASTTLNVYAHAVPGGDRQAAEALALILAASARQRCNKFFPVATWPADQAGARRFITRIATPAVRMNVPKAISQATAEGTTQWLPAGPSM